MAIVVELDDNEMSKMEVVPLPIWKDWYLDCQYVLSSEVVNVKKNIKENNMNKSDVLKGTLTNYERDILELADEMASAMSDLNAHNYKNFVDARDKFRDKLKELSSQTMASHEKVERMKKVIADF